MGILSGDAVNVNPQNNPMASGNTAAVANGQVQQAGQINPMQAAMELVKKLVGNTPNLPGAVMSTTPVAKPLQQKEKFNPTVDNREFATSSGNRRVGFNNMMQNITGMVNTAAKNIENKNARALSIDMERLFAAQSGLEQAKANPNDPASKAAIATNTQIINDIMGDAKKRKNLEKAFNFNILGNDKDKDSWQRKAFIESAKKYKEAQAKGESALNPYADLFGQQQPKQLTENPQYAAMEKAVKAGLIVSPKDQFNAAAKMTEASIAGDSREAVAKTTGDSRIEAAKISAKERMDATKLRVDGMVKVAKEATNRATLVQKAITDRGEKPSKEATVLFKQAEAVQKYINTISERINAEKHWYKWASPKQKELEKLLDGLKSKQDAINNKITGMGMSASAKDDGSKPEPEPEPKDNEITPESFDDFFKDDDSGA